MGMALTIHCIVALGFYALYKRPMNRTVAPPVSFLHLDYWLKLLMRVAVTRLYLPYLVAGLLCLYLLPTTPYQGATVSVLAVSILPFGFSSRTWPRASSWPGERCGVFGMLKRRVLTSRPFTESS